ncbi:S1C family serine protease [Ornithinibacillus salinisoli]|uniref:S1C family serine protease n=1 Tax=Ornithinibacillus salinisoli TaxID=1848459 RepID=A0ABW4W336_9BACI
MGYYDNHYPPNPHRKKGNRWLVPLLLGVVIGILLVSVAIPAVFNSNLVDNQQGNYDSAEITQGNNNDNPSSMSVDITTQITNVVQQVAPTVVGVTNIQRQNSFLQQQEGTEAGTGSGVIYKIDGQNAYIVTNYHVVEGADELEIVLYDDTHVEAELLGGDLFSDLAVLRMDGDVIEQTIEMGSSENIKVGEPAIAIGNPLGHMFAGSVTQGIISGTQRTIPQDFDYDGRADWQAEVIQTDAAINPGNSGGALINMEGLLIGINSMKVNQEAVEGIGFSIPIDVARPIIEELEKEGSVTRPFIGVEIYSLDEVPQSEWKETLNLPGEVEGGVYVWSVDPLSPADQAGLERLDVITHLDDVQVMNMIDLRKILYQEKEVGDEINITYYRNGEKQETTLKLGVQ